MPLEHAILGFLSRRPTSGYDLKKLFDVTVQHFWAADQAQIYRTLARLHRQGWAELEVVEQDDRPDRKVYSITPAGRQELHRWLTTPVAVHRPHSEPLLQIFLAGLLNDDEAQAMLDYAEHFFRGVLERYNGIPAPAVSDATRSANPRQAFFMYLTLDLGKKVAEAQLVWAEEARRRFQELRAASINQDSD